MTPQERRHALALAGIFSSRMLGLFMVLPVLALYVKQLEGATQSLVGAALGIYGLFQAVLQMPLGLWSDRIGRKPVIALGLVVFIAGSVVAAVTHSIHGIIIGRALQGAGAVGSTTLALMADVTSNENRTQAMALIGMMIGLAFFAALGIGPIVNHLAGLDGIFWLTALLAGGGLLLLWLAVPTPGRIQLHQDVEAVPAQLWSILKKSELLRLDWGIGVLHSVLTALFIVLPLILRHDLNLADSHMAYYYLPIAVIAFAAMVPFIIVAEKKRQMKTVYVSMIIALLGANLVIGLFNTNIWLVTVGLLVFLSAFSALEALLPSLVSKQCPPDRKGSAMGVYSSSQFFGIFIGGVIGGLAWQYFGFAGVFTFSSLLLAIWLLLAVTMKQPPYLSTKIYDISRVPKERLSSLKEEMAAVNGVSEVVVMPDTGVAYLKVDTKMVQYDHIDDVIQRLMTNNRS